MNTVSVSLTGLDLAIGNHEESIGLARLRLRHGTDNGYEQYKILEGESNVMLASEERRIWRKKIRMISSTPIHRQRPPTLPNTALLVMPRHPPPGETMNEQH